MFMRLAISLPNHPKLLRELRLLERRASRMGKDVVDHGRNGSDDYANVVVGALKALAPGSYNRNFKEWVGTDSETDDKSKDGRQTHAAQMLLWHLRSHGIRV